MISIMEARVVDFPLPVGPVTRISPLGLLHKNSETTSGRPEFLKSFYFKRDGSDCGSNCAALDKNISAETRKILDAEGEIEFTVFPRIYAFARPSKCCKPVVSYRTGPSAGKSSSGFSSPFRRILGGESTVICRSEPFISTMRFKSSLRLGTAMKCSPLKIESRHPRVEI